MSNGIMLVAGGILQQPAVRAAHELGYRVLVTDRDPNCACAKLADHFVQLDTFDADGHCELARRVRPAAVFTAGADPIVTVARASRLAAIPGTLSLEVAETCANKPMTRQVLAAHNVPQPRFEMASLWAEEERYLDELRERGWSRIILKATSSSGSRGHTRLDITETTPEQWKAAYIRAGRYSISSSLIEELLTGIELSVETLWYDGTMIPLNAVERPFMDHPQFSIELGHYNPWIGSPEDYDAVWHVAELAGQAIGMAAQRGGHIFKVDAIVTDDGPKVLECTTRLSGGFDSGWTTPLAHGSDYVKGALLLALGEPLHVTMPYFAKRWARHAACMAVFGPPEGGIIKEIRGLDKSRKIANYVILRFKVGDELPPLEDCGSRVAFCIVGGWNDYRARNDARMAAEAIEVICE